MGTVMFSRASGVFVQFLHGERATIDFQNKCVIASGSQLSPAMVTSTSRHRRCYWLVQILVAGVLRGAWEVIQPCASVGHWVGVQPFCNSQTRTSRHQLARDVELPPLLSDEEVKHIQAVVRAKCLEAIAVGGLPPGRELELISALDLGTVPWSLLPIKFKEQLRLPLEDKGIDSLALNLSVAVQAKDYTNGTVPLNRLTNFHFMVRADNSPLRKLVQSLVVATNESTELPKHWQQFSGAIQRIYTPDEIKVWRRKAKRKRRKEDGPPQRMRNDFQRWPHQLECLRCCRNFLKNQSQRDFFVQMATGAGKSLVMADLLADLAPNKRACIIVPKLDLMEQLVQLLEGTISARVGRVGTGHPADLSAEVFVCVRNSAWQLSNLTFGLLLLDEAHHYEPGDELQSSGVHARQVLTLDTPKRIFFTATLRRTQPDFDFGLRPAIQAGVIKDYSVMVPVLTAGDPRPSLVRLIQNLPLARKILAFCNTVHEAKAFTQMLLDAGIPSDHYNAHTAGGHRQKVLKRFQCSERFGGIRVLVTVDVLSEGVDLPVADTCLFVAPRRGIRLQQCVGRVLRNHCEKIDALVIAPPVVQDAGGMLAEDAELGRLLSELAKADHVFKAALTDGISARSRITIAADKFKSTSPEEVAQILRIRVFPHALRTCTGLDRWEMGFQELLAFKAKRGTCLAPQNHKTSSGFSLGTWVSTQRRANRTGKLSREKFDRLEVVGFVWAARAAQAAYPARISWDEAYRELLAFKAERGTCLVPRDHKTSSGFSLGRWVDNQRGANRAGKLSPDKFDRLEAVGFVWAAYPARISWDDVYQELLAFKAERGNCLVPQNHKTSSGFSLGWWVSTQRRANRAGQLSQEKFDRLEAVGFVWAARAAYSARISWDEAHQELLVFKAEHGTCLVPRDHKTSSGFSLGRWVSNQRGANRAGKLSQGKFDRLEAVDFVWAGRVCISGRGKEISNGK